MDKMAGKRYSREEINQIKTLINEGLSNREIALRLGRPEAGIRNLRYRHGLKSKAENETKTLFEQRDKLRIEVSQLQRKHSELSRLIEALEKRKETLKKILKLNEFSLQVALTSALTKLRIEKPELFTLNQQEQTAILIGLIMKSIFSK